MNLTLIQLAGFVDDWRHEKLGDDDLRALENQVMGRPESGAVMAGTGGLRKVRFAPPSSRAGKSGGLRVCYAYFPQYARLYLVTTFAKNERANLGDAEKKAIRGLLQRIDKALRKNKGASDAE